MADAGPSEGFLSSYFRNPFKKKKRSGDIDLPMPPGGRRDPRLPRHRGDVGEKIKEGASIFRKLLERSRSQK